MNQRLAIGALALAASAAWAVSPHFISATGAVDTSGTLVVDFKEAGLGANVLVDYVLTTVASASYQCYNKGSNTPQGNPYQLSDQGITVPGSFSSGKNGQITASIDAGPPDPAPAEAALKCVEQGNKQLCLQSVSYANTRLTDTTFGPWIDVTPNPAERSFAVPTKKNPSPSNCVSS